MTLLFKFSLFVLLFKVQYAKLPDIVIFAANDLGGRDVGCFEKTTIKTPNIDKLAQDGTKLSHHLTASGLCTPSRAALLTGRHPAKQGMSASESLIFPVLGY